MSDVKIVPVIFDSRDFVQGFNFSGTPLDIRFTHNSRGDYWSIALYDSAGAVVVPMRPISLLTDFLHGTGIAGVLMAVATSSWQSPSLSNTDGFRLVYIV